MINNAIANLLPDHFGSADQAVLAVTALVDLKSAAMLGGYIVFSTEHQHYRISRPASTQNYPWVESSQKGILNLDPNLRFCGTYCTSDTAGASQIAYEFGERALYRNFFAPAFLARMIAQDMTVRRCAGYWMAADSAVLKFRSDGGDNANDLIAHAPAILNALIDGTGSMRSYIQQVASAGDLLVLQKSKFPGIWDTLGVVPVNWDAPVQSN